MLQETVEIRNLIWLSNPLVLGDLRKQGEGQSLSCLLSLASMSFSISSHTHTHVVRHRYTQTCKGSGEQTREGKVDAMILFGGEYRRGGVDDTQHDVT